MTQYDKTPVGMVLAARDRADARRFWKRFGIALALLLMGFVAVWVLSKPASAMSVCANLAKVEELLAGTGVKPVAGWVERDAGQRVLFATPDGSRWVMVAVINGWACTMREGASIEVWHTVPLKPTE